LAWRREGRWEFQVAPIFTYLDFKIPYPGNGYWSPDWMRNGSLDAVVRTSWRRWTLHLTGRVGREKEADSPTITVGSALGRIGWRFDPRALVSLEAGYSESALTSPSGYNRFFLNLSLKAFF